MPDARELAQLTLLNGRSQSTFANAQTNDVKESRQVTTREFQRIYRGREVWKGGDGGEVLADPISNTSPIQGQVAPIISTGDGAHYAARMPRS